MDCPICFTADSIGTTRCYVCGAEFGRVKNTVYSEVQPLKENRMSETHDPVVPITPAPEPVTIPTEAKAPSYKTTARKLLTRVLVPAGLVLGGAVVGARLAKSDTDDTSVDDLDPVE